MTLDTDRLKADIRAIVADQAVARSTIYYGELVDTLKVMNPESYAWHLMPDYKFFYDLLGNFSAQMLEKQYFALTSLVVGKSTNLPGKNFLDWGHDARWLQYDQVAKVLVEKQHSRTFEYFRLFR